MARTRREWRLVEVIVKENGNVLDDIQALFRSPCDPATSAIVQTLRQGVERSRVASVDQFDFDRSFWEMASFVQGSRRHPPTIAML